MRWVVLGIAFAGTAFAHDVITTNITWAREVSRLVYKRCASCHREGGTAFSLTTYEAARPWAKAIKEEVLNRTMPPWAAVKGFGSFRNDQGLTQEEIDLIASWVEGGTPEGDPSLLPQHPDYGLIDKKLRTGPAVSVTGALALKYTFTLAALRPSGNAQVIARFPDGRIEPLLWVAQYQRQYPRTYYLREPIVMPAGTRIEVTGPGPVSLLPAISVHSRAR